MNFKEIIEKYFKGGKNKNFSNLLLVFLVGVILVITASFFNSSSSTTKKDTQSSLNGSNGTNNTALAVDAYEQDMNNQLKSLLAQIDGVGKVTVMITFDGGEESVPAVNDNEGTSSTEDSSNGQKNTTTQGTKSSTIVTINDADGSTKPLIVKIYKPKVISVAVVAEGADNSLTELRITKTVTDLLNVTDSKVNVLPMKK